MRNKLFFEADKEDPSKERTNFVSDKGIERVLADAYS
jgi:hypothetical protein